MSPDQASTSQSDLPPNFEDADDNVFSPSVPSTVPSTNLALTFANDNPPSIQSSSTTNKRSADTVLEEDSLSNKKRRRSRAIKTATISIGEGKTIEIDRKDAPSWPGGGIRVVKPVSKLIKTWDRDSADWNPSQEYSEQMSILVEGERQVIGIKDLPQLYHHNANEKGDTSVDKTKHGPGWTTTERNQWNGWEVKSFLMFPVLLSHGLACL